MLLAHAGNRIDAVDRTPPRFPATQIGPVTAVIGRLLADLRPSAVVSPPANGADLIILTEAQRLGIATHVVLPLPVREFQLRSVESSTWRWVECYDQVLDVAATTPGSSVEKLDLREEDPEWYLAGNRLILDVARRLAGDDETVVAITVRPPEGETPPSATDDFARRAQAAGLTVLTVDPRPGSTGSVQVT